MQQLGHLPLAVQQVCQKPVPHWSRGQELEWWRCQVRAPRVASVALNFPLPQVPQLLVHLQLSVHRQFWLRLRLHLRHRLLVQEPTLRRMKQFAGKVSKQMFQMPWLLALQLRSSLQLGLPQSPPCG